VTFTLTSRRSALGGLIAASSALLSFPQAAALSPRAFGRFTTSYREAGEQAHRAHNIELTVSAIDGLTLRPGETFSFNEVVGERTPTSGYDRSIVLRRGLLAEGVGGGACQVASTLHAAALLAGLDIVARAPHSRPSAYIRVGLDATVVYPSIDLKLRNASDDVVVVRATARHGTLTVAIEGEPRERPHVVVTSEITNRVYCGRTIVHDRSVPDGEAVIRAYGIPGYRVLRTRTVETGGKAFYDERIDTYPSVPEIIAVNPALDVHRLRQEETEQTPEGDIPPAIVRTAPGTELPMLSVTRPPTRFVVDNDT
jgi:VanW like protein